MATIAITSPAASQAIPSAPQQVAKFTATLGDDYTTGDDGWDVSAGLPDGATVVAAHFIPMYDGSTLRWGRVEMNGAVPWLRVYENDNGAPGAETTTADQSDNIGIEFIAFIE